MKANRTLFGFTKNELDELAGIFSSFSEIEEVIIFGSRAVGNFKQGSDVDLAIKGKIDDRALTRLSMRLNDESNLPYVFDVMDIAKITNADLREHIAKYGKRMYLKK